MAPKKPAPKSTPNTPAAKTPSPISAGIEQITGGYKPVVTPKDATGMQGVGITGTDRNVAKEIEAAKLGYSAEYIASRGGINSQGYFNDVALSGQLSAAEQQSVRLPNGTVNTQAMADILQKKQIDELVAKGMSLTEATKQVSAQYGIYGTKMPTLIPDTNTDVNINPVLGGSSGSNVTPGASGLGGSTVPAGPTMASDVFKQTLAIFFGAAEMTKPWVNELYNVVSKFYKQGATSEEAFNMAILDSRNNPALADFTKRFKGIYALQDMKQAGKAVTVPTIAEYFATEAKMGDVLKQSSLGDLANEDFLGDVLSKGVSATEFANRITTIFDRIDNAPTDIKNTLSRFFPTVDRLSLAKAIALGDKGAKELQTQVAGYEVLSAAEKQGLSAGQLVGGTTEEKAYQYALGGETYDTALTKFGTVAAMLPTVNKLTQIYGDGTLGQAGVESAVFDKSAKEIRRLEEITRKEEASFSGRSGVSQISLPSQRRGAGAF